MTELSIDFCGERHEIHPGGTLSFGRLGDLRIDDNKYLHRVMGLFRWHTSLWWLDNVGSHLPMQIEGRLRGSSITLSPGSSVPLVFGASFVRFAAGGTSYEIVVDAPVEADASTSPDLLGETTVDAGSLPLTPEQLLLLVALAETRLRRGTHADLPSNIEIAERFGWSVVKFNRKLDGLCVKFGRRGVAGLVGSADRMAQNRRVVLVDHLIASGLVTVEQLSLLPPKQGSAPASAGAPRSVPSPQALRETHRSPTNQFHPHPESK